MLSLTPAQAVELRKADQEFAAHMAELGLKADTLKLEADASPCRIGPAPGSGR